MGSFEIADTENGKLITFEGGEGAGKSTQVALLADYLETKGIKFVKTREPGGSSGAEDIRRLLVEGAVDRWDSIAETLLLMAGRRSHFKELLEPALIGGKWVICDRFSDSTLAYQGYGQGVDLEMISQLQYLAIGEFAPDLTFLLDIPVNEGLSRAEERGATAR
ncbi:MAG: Thymidylate kinase, partial [Alphaproteobacteria bacterium MarineAlpha4_Bin2]